MPRLFIALPVPPDVGARVLATRIPIEGARWVPQHQLHVTLRFLGGVTPTRADQVAGALATVSAPAFQLQLAGVGAFPGVLWAGLAPAAPLAALKAAVDAALGPDAEGDARGFVPHITVARVRDDDAGALTAYRAHATDLASPPWDVESLVLFESERGSDGAVHTPRLVHRFAAP